MGNRLSPSTISLFLNCPRCFWLHFNKEIKRPSTIFPTLPVGMDRVLKRHFDSHRESKIKPEELKGIDGRLFSDTEKLNEWRNNFRGLRFSDTETGFVLMGALDDLFVTSDGKHAPLDFKTRGFPRKDNTHIHYQHQMDIYSFLLKKNGMEPADFAILIFYHPINVNNNHDIVFDHDSVKMPVSPERGWALFKDAVQCIKGEIPEPSEYCDFCRLMNMKTYSKHI